MRLSDLTPEQILKFYEARVDRLRRGSGDHQYEGLCPFHDDRTPSFGVNVRKGAWSCQRCGISGKLIDFETRFSGCDGQAAVANIAEILGLEHNSFAFAKQQPDAVYTYTDEFGRTLYEVLRYKGADGKKRISQRKPDPDKPGSFVYDLGIGGQPRRVLYHLPEVVTANTVLISEGEKDCDKLRGLLWPTRDNTRLAFTTSPGGAGKWSDEYAPYFAGKTVVIFQDDDDKGRQHALRTAYSIWRYTQRVRLVELPDGVHDVGDFIDTGAGADDLIAIIGKTPWWSPPDIAQGFFVGADTFLLETPDVEIDWAIEGFIERGSNGVIAAIPKGGKSWLALDMGLHMAMGIPWMGRAIPRPMNVAVCAREDNPATTRRRLNMLRGAFPAMDLNERLYLNTRRQTKTLMLDNADELKELIVNCKLRGIEFLFLDVFNKLHSAEENDNTAMRRVLDHVERIQNEAGCSVCILHHTAKADNPDAPVVAGFRGASSIAGFAEFAGRIDITDPNPKRTIRRLRWESKADEAPEPIQWRIKGDKILRTAQIVQVEPDVEEPEAPPECDEWREPKVM